MIIKILFTLVVIGIVGCAFMVYSNPATYDFGKFSIEKKQLDNIADQMGSEFVLCNNDGGCVMVGKINSNGDEEYSGPVPEGYNEEHLRKTGETIPNEVEE